MSIAKTDGKVHHYAHHYESAEHEFASAKQGVWLFLCTEILMFGGLFVGYAIYHHLYPELFKVGSMFTDWRLGAANTVVLLTSSLTMALGIHYSQVNQPQKTVKLLGVTILCGFIFMAIKYVEYSHKIHLGLLPGSWFHANPEELAHIVGREIPSNLALYFSFYYMMTGLHGIHVLVGIGLMTWVMRRANRGEFSSEYYTPVEGVGLFWHLVDLVWIYLFPLLYLVA
jgi:cytochrome c oxidase subunit 3